MATSGVVTEQIAKALEVPKGLVWQVMRRLVEGGHTPRGGRGTSAKDFNAEQIAAAALAVAAVFGHTDRAASMTSRVIDDIKELKTERVGLPLRILDGEDEDLAGRRFRFPYAEGEFVTVIAYFLEEWAAGREPLNGRLVEVGLVYGGLGYRTEEGAFFHGFYNVRPELLAPHSGKTFKWPVRFDPDPEYRAERAGCRREITISRKALKLLSELLPQKTSDESREAPLVTNSPDAQPGSPRRKRKTTLRKSKRIPSDERSDSAGSRAKEDRRT